MLSVKEQDESVIVEITTKSKNEYFIDMLKYKQRLINVL
jgi:hypothetical protein